MPSTLVPCVDCEKVKKALEDGGGVKVEGCETVPEDVNKPRQEQWCRITWKYLAI